MYNVVTVERKSVLYSLCEVNRLHRSPPVSPPLVRSAGGRAVQRRQRLWARAEARGAALLAEERECLQAQRPAPATLFHLFFSVFLFFVYLRVFWYYILYLSAFWYYIVYLSAFLCPTTSSAESARCAQPVGKLWTRAPGWLVPCSLSVL